MNLVANASLKAFITRPAIWVSSFALLFFSGCATEPTSHVWFSDGQIRRQQIDNVLLQNPLAPGANIQVTNLGHSDSVSHHLVQIRSAEPLHIHENHDLTVCAYRGHGTLQLGTDRIPLNTGDIAFIPRGIPHAFRNESPIPAVAVVIFTPAFDGKDTVPIRGKP